MVSWLCSSALVSVEAVCSSAGPAEAPVTRPHAACDFRKLAGLECYCVSDNVSELTARINDEGWDTAYAAWLAQSRLDPHDTVFVFSVGGGNEDAGISVNLVNAMKFANRVGASITGIVGRDGGTVAKMSEACVVIPEVNASHVTPQTEGLQALIWHLMVSHPDLAITRGKWETVA